MVSDDHKSHEDMKTSNLFNHNEVLLIASFPKISPSFCLGQIITFLNEFASFSLHSTLFDQKV